MENLKGKQLTIKNIEDYKYHVAENYWVWSDEMLIPISKDGFVVGDRMCLDTINSTTSKRIQEKLFELGYKWSSGDTRVDTDYSWLYLDTDKSLTHDNGSYGEDSDYRIITVDDILMTTTEERTDGGFKVGDRVIKYRRYSSTEYCSYGGNEKTVPLGTKGIIEEILRDDNVRVSFDNKTEWNLNPSELEAVRSITTIEDKEEKTKMEQPKTTLEKNACKKAREEVIKKKTEAKQKEYEREMDAFASNEKDARYYREKADEKRKVLGISSADMKELGFD